MALIKCKECGNEVSSDAKTCPQCGKKVKKKMSCLQMIGVVMAIFVFFAIARACMGDPSDSSSVEEVNSLSQQRVSQKEKGKEPSTEAKPSSEGKKSSSVKGKPKAAPEKNFIGIGDPVQVGDMVFQVNEIGFAKTIGNDFVKETADGIFLLINMSMKNISKKSKTIDNSLFKLQDKEGAEYEFSTKGSTTLEMSGNKTLFLKQCQPNIVTSGILVFEVPKEGNYLLHMSDGMWSGKTAKVLLKKPKQK